jgi:hypothetical protein
LNASRSDILAPATTAVLIAQQVAANASRDGLLLSSYPVTALPYFITGACLAGILAAHASGRLLTLYGPARIAPAILSTSALLFALEWVLLGFPRAASVLLYLHSTVLGAIGISAFWSMMNERFDPHSAKALIAKTAGAATLGGLLGGLGAERVAAVFSPAALLLVLAALGIVATTGALGIARGSAAVQPRTVPDDPPQPWSEVRRTPLLRNLALVTVLGAAVAALADYFLKAEAVAWLGKGEPLVRFFGIFYAATGAGAFLLQVAVGRVALSRLGLGGSVAMHPAVVGAVGLLGFVVPAPWRGIFPRGLDMTLRNSLVRSGYELLYTPLPPSAKRSVKSLIDVTGDSVGKAVGAGLALMATRLAPAHSLVEINLAIVIAAALEFAVARRLKVGYVTELEGGLRRHSDDLPESAQQPLNQATLMLSLTGMDASALQQAIAETPSDPVAAAYAALRSGNSTRVRAALATLPRDPSLIGVLVSLLDNRHTLRQTTAALKSFGPRAAGEMVSALLDSSTPEVVRRRLPMVLEHCESTLARDGLLEALMAEPLDVRARAARALLGLTEKFPTLTVAPDPILAAAERQLRSGDASHPARDFVFNLLALAFEREPIAIAARSIDSSDAWARGTALEYFETVLPPGLYAALCPVLAAPAPTAPPREPSAVRADLFKAGTTMTMSLAEVRRQLKTMDEDEEGESA